MVGAFAVAKPSRWDYLDQRTLKVYSLVKPQEGEVAITMGHKQMLETFLRDSQNHDKTTYLGTKHNEPVVLIIGDNATLNVASSIRDALVEMINKVKYFNWDLIQLG
jgi:hypothetical protein